jgi:hypothetical protein
MTTTARPVRCRVRDAADPIRRRVPFIAGAMSGEWVTAEDPGTVGRLDEYPELLAEYRAALARATGPVYRVNSYRTCVAYGLPGEPLRVFPAKWSRTTTTHTSECLHAAR